MNLYSQWQNKIIDYIGIDKIVHFLVGALIVALVSPLGWSYVGGAVLVVVFISVLKELILDDKRDWYDVLCAIIGCAFSAGVYGIIDWFN